MPSAMLFSGPRGTGKTTAGRIVAAALNAPDGEGDVAVDDPRAQAVFDGSSYDVLEIDAASHGGVDDVRALQSRLQYRTTGEWRVVLLDEAHSMSTTAYNALLKTLEEPPPQTLFILLTTEPHRILHTVVSRCWPLEFRRVKPSDIVKRLREIADTEGFEAADGLLVDIARRSDGGLRDAVMLLDQCSRVGVADADGLAEFLGESDFAPKVLSAIAAGDAFTAVAALDEEFGRCGDAGRVLSDLTDCLSDLFLLSRVPEAVDPARLRVRQTLVKSCPPMRLLQIVQPLWDLRARPSREHGGPALRHAVAVCAKRGYALKPKEPEAPATADDLQELLN